MRQDMLRKLGLAATRGEREREKHIDTVTKPYMYVFTGEQMHWWASTGRVRIWRLSLQFTVEKLIELYYMHIKATVQPSPSLFHSVNLYYI